MIRVLHYGMGPNLGGIETYLLNLARTIDSSRFQFDFLYSDQGKPPVFLDELAASRFIGVTPRRMSPRRNRAEIAALFARERFDILHFHAVSASYVEPVRQALGAGVPVLVHSHGSGAASSLLTRTLHQWNRRWVPWHRVGRLAVSNEAGRWMFGAAPFTVIHNGIDLETFRFRPVVRASTRRTLGLADRMFVVGVVGALLPVKNHEFSLRVFREIRVRRPDAVLLLAGDGPCETDLRRLAEHLGVAEAVHFLGRRSDVAALLSAMDCLLLPSLHEGFPIVALEAQASGLPCLLSATITEEVVLTPDCRRLPLGSPAVWADQVIRTPAGVDRSSGEQVLRETGISLEASTARVVQSYEQAR